MQRMLRALGRGIQNLLGGQPPAGETASQTREESAPAETPAPVTRRVSLIIYDPLIPSEGGQRLTRLLHWNDPDRLGDDLIRDLREVSHGYANYMIKERVLVDDFPVKKDGFQYTGAEYLRCWRQHGGFHQPDDVNYHRILDQHHLLAKVAGGEIDEVWTVGFPYAGFYEFAHGWAGRFLVQRPTPGRHAGRRAALCDYGIQL